MLKEMIERKRRNDFVRKREFDMLRKMRRSEVMAGQDPMARPSFFQSSMPSKPDDRRTTLKKIDEIEAQMSMQWWKTKHGDSSLRSTGSAALPASAHAPIENGGCRCRPIAGNSYTRTAPQPLEPLATPAPSQAPRCWTRSGPKPTSRLQRPPGGAPWQDRARRSCPPQRAASRPAPQRPAAGRPGDQGGDSASVEQQRVLGLQADRDRRR
jgi:hypothetical protein